MAEDLRAILSRLAEQVVLLRSLREAPGEERVAIARETLDIYAPLANRLGIWQLKWELEDLSFRYLEPERYQDIARIIGIGRGKLAPPSLMLTMRRTFMPSAAAQSVMDVSLFWGKTIGGSLRVDFPSAFSNLNRGKSLKNGRVFENTGPARWGLCALGAWAVGAYWAAWFALRGRERG